MIAGPDWKGEKPAGIKKYSVPKRSSPSPCIRTQLFGRGHPNVKKVQAGYKAQTLSQFLNKPAPPAAPEIEWPKFAKELKGPFARI